MHDLIKKKYLLLPKSVWLFVGPTFLFGPAVFWLYMTPSLFYPSSPSVNISGNEFSLWLSTACYTMIIRQHCSVMILPFLPALEPRLDLFVIIHHPFPLSSCIISIILRVSTWLNLIHLTKKKNSHHWTEINQLPTAHLTYPLLQASHKARKHSLSEDKCGNIDCVGRNIPQVMIRHFHNAQSSERTISEGRSLSGDPITQALW